MIELSIQTSKGSFHDSAIKIDELIKEASERGFRSLGIADKTMGGVIDFYDACTKNKIKPLIGKVFEINKFKVILYAKNLEGYHDLIRLNNELNINPNNEISRKLYKNLICIIPRIGGELSHSIEKTNCSEESLRNLVNKYKQDFGNIFIEISDNNLRYEKNVNDYIIKIGKSTGVKVILPGNVRYLKKEDQVIHNILMRIKHNTRNDGKKMKGTNYHFRSKEEFCQDYNEYLENNSLVSDLIESFSPYENNGKFFMPSFPLEDSFIKNRCETFLEDKGILDEKHLKRLDYELSIITKEKYSGYFILVADVCDWCRDNDILVGVGRGSAGGSLVAYAMGITGFDPIDDRCPLYFERFLNPSRVSPPDIDVDIMDRDAVINYLKGKYGKDHVVNIGTIMSNQTKASLNHVCRVYGISDILLKDLYKTLPKKDGYNCDSLYQDNPEFKMKLDSNSVLKNVWEYARRIEGLCLNHGVHASGVLVCQDELKLPKNIDDGTVYSEYDMDNSEKLGYIKFDFLGLNTLKVIRNCVDKIKENQNIDLDIFNINPWDNDPKVINLINEFHTGCVFQFDSDAFKKLIKDMHPDNFNELIEITALVRPGPMESGLTQQYINRKFKRELVSYPHPSLKKVLTRQGVPIFQEEVMNLCVVLAGFSMAEADIIRKAIGKKKQDLLDEQRPKFIEGCFVTSGLDRGKAADLFDMIEKFGRYSFNLSHSLAYTIITYWTAYLSAYFPVEFFAANMDIRGDKQEKLIPIIEQAKSRGINIEKPNINFSENLYKAVGDTIYMAFNGIKSVGERAKEAIVEERKKNGPFDSFENFIERVPKSHCSALAKEALIYSGVLDTFSDEDILTKRIRFLDAVINKKNQNKMKDFNELNLVNLIMKEKNYLGFYLKDNPKTALRLNFYNEMVEVFEIIAVRRHIDKKGNQMAFIQATNYEKTFDLVCFSKLYTKMKDVIKPENILVVKFGYGNSGNSLLMNDCFPIYSGEELIPIDMKGIVPVVDFSEEVSGGLNFNRFVKYEKEGKVILFKGEGSGPIQEEKITGYRIL